MTATEYLELKRKGIDPFPFEEKPSEMGEDEMFEQLGELVEQYPIGRP